MLMDYSPLRSQLPRSLRAALSMDQIGRLVDIAPVLEHIVVRTQHDKIDALPDKFLVAASSAFSHYEKKLWYVFLDYLYVTFITSFVNNSDPQNTPLSTGRRI
jgi:hypothetical protein